MAKLFPDEYKVENFIAMHKNDRKYLGEEALKHITASQRLYESANKNMM
jgi:hypothetical protein